MRRCVLNAIMCGGGGSSGGALTNLQAGRMGMNAGKITSSYYSRMYVDYVRRFYTPFIVPGSGSTPVALDVSGNPAASYEIVLTANPLTVDLGTYTLWVQGGTFTSAQKSSSTTTTVVNFGAPTSDGAGNTYCAMTVVSGGGVMGVVVNNPSAGAKAAVILPAGFTLANKDDFHPDAIKQMGLGTTIRSLDVVQNSVTDTDWAGSIAAGGDGSVRGKTQSLAEFCRFAKACGNAAPWVNIVPLATNVYITSFLSVMEAGTSAGVPKYIEWGDEPWNFSFPTYDLLTQMACQIAYSYAGNAASMPSSTNAIKSCTRDGAGTATAVITGTPKNGTTTGKLIYVAGITNITGGLVPITASVNNGDGTWSISWAESGAAVTGTVAPGSHTYNSYIHTDVETGAVHYLVAPLVTYGGSTTPVSPYVMKGRMVIERLRAVWTAAQLLPNKADYRICLNNQVGSGSGNGLSENEAYAYAFERWGDHSWIYTCASAPYFSSETASQAASTAADVLTALEHTGAGCLDTFPQLLVRDGNAAASWGHAKAFYEGGPANTNVGSAGAAIGAAHRDLGMTTLNKRLFTMMRDYGQTGPFCYYGGGAVATFGSGNNQMWALNENGDPGDFTQAKALSLVQWGASSSVPTPIDGYTSGTINIPFVWSSSFGSGDSNGCRIAATAAALCDCGIQVMKTLAGNYPISVYACSTSASDWVSIWINGVQVANQIPLTVQNPTVAAPSTPVWSSASYPFKAGRNVVLIRIQPTGRVGTIGFNQVVSPNTPV